MRECGPQAWQWRNHIPEIQSLTLGLGRHPLGRGQAALPHPQGRPGQTHLLKDTSPPTPNPLPPTPPQGLSVLE